MRDIVPELHLLAQAHASGPNEDGHVIAQAAEEIKRLRAEVQKYKDKEAAIFRMWNDPASQRGKARAMAHHPTIDEIIEDAEAAAGIVRAYGWAVIDRHGDIRVSTVSPTRRRAIVNWLVTDKGLFISNATPDEEIERQWKLDSEDFNASVSRVVITTSDS